MGPKERKRLTCDLVDRSCEPFSCAYKPETHTVGDDDSNGDNGIVQRLVIHGVHLRENEGDTNEGNPKASKDGYGVRKRSQMEWSTNKG